MTQPIAVLLAGILVVQPLSDAAAQSFRAPAGVPAASLPAPLALGWRGFTMPQISWFLLSSPDPRGQARLDDIQAMLRRFEALKERRGPWIARLERAGYTPESLASRLQSGKTFDSTVLDLERAWEDASGDVARAADAAFRGEATPEQIADLLKHKAYLSQANAEAVAVVATDAKAAEIAGRVRRQTSAWTGQSLHAAIPGEEDDRGVEDPAGRELTAELDEEIASLQERFSRYDGVRYSYSIDYDPKLSRYFGRVSVEFKDRHALDRAAREIGLPSETQRYAHPIDYSVAEPPPAPKAAQKPGVDGASSDAAGPASAGAEAVPSGPSTAVASERKGPVPASDLLWGGLAVSGAMAVLAGVAGIAAPETVDAVSKLREPAMVFVGLTSAVMSLALRGSGLLGLMGGAIGTFAVFSLPLYAASGFSPGYFPYSATLLLPPFLAWLGAAPGWIATLGWVGAAAIIGLVPGSTGAFGAGALMLSAFGTSMVLVDEPGKPYSGSLRKLFGLGSAVTALLALPTVASAAGGLPFTGWDLLGGAAAGALLGAFAAWKQTQEDRERAGSSLVPFGREMAAVLNFLVLVPIGTVLGTAIGAFIGLIR